MPRLFSLKLLEVHNVKKRRSWWLLLLVPVLVVCMLFTGAAGGGICTGGIKLASMIDGLEALIDPDGLISLAKGTGLDQDVLKILQPQGKRDGRDIYALDASCGSAETLLDRVAEQEGWLSEEEAAGLAKIATGVAGLTFLVVVYGFVTRRRLTFAM